MRHPATTGARSASGPSRAGPRNEDQGLRILRSRSGAGDLSSSQLFLVLEKRNVLIPLKTAEHGEHSIFVGLISHTYATFGVR
jgi:hypothetical protein